MSRMEYTFLTLTIGFNELGRQIPNKICLNNPSPFENQTCQNWIKFAGIRHKDWPYNEYMTDKSSDAIRSHRNIWLISALNTQCVSINLPGLLVPRTEHHLSSFKCGFLNIFRAKTCCVVCHAYCFGYGGTNMAQKKRLKTTFHSTFEMIQL